MHSLETGIIVSIAAFFFLSFLTFTFLRETNISNEIKIKVVDEKKEYSENYKRKFSPETVINITNIIIEGGDKNVRENKK